MATSSLKISNVHLNLDELVARLKKVQSPGKKKLVDAITEKDFRTIYKELLYRIELYTKTKVLNYTGKDLNEIVKSVYTYGIEPFVSKLVEKAVDELVELDELYESQCLTESDDYEDFFRTKLEEYGVQSPDELSDDEMKRFFNEINTEWS